MDNIIRLITNEEGLDEAQAEMGRLLEIGERSPAEDNLLDVLAVLIRSYEDEHWPLALPDPVFAIKYRMDELGLQQSDMVVVFGNKATASQMTNRKRALTLPIIRRLSAKLSLPIAVLAQEYSVTAANAASPKRKSATSPKGKSATFRKRKSVAPPKRKSATR